MPRGCDVCGCAQTDPIYEQRFAAFDDRSAFDGYDVVACTACRFVYADGIPGQAAFDTYYREMSMPNPIIPLFGEGDSAGC